MSNVVLAFLAFGRSWFRTRLSLQLEVLALRHQLAVCQLSVKRPQLKAADRLLWVSLSRLWSGWERVLVFVQLRQ